MESIADMARKLAKKASDEAREKAEAELRQRQADEARSVHMDKQIKQAFLEVAELPGFEAKDNVLFFQGRKVAEAKVVVAMVPEEYSESLHPPEHLESVYQLWTQGCTEARHGYGNGRPLPIPYYRYADTFRSALANYVAQYVGGK